MTAVAEEQTPAIASSTQPAVGAPAVGKSSDLAAGLRAAVAQCRTIESYYREVFERVAEAFGAPCGAFRLDHQTGVTKDDFFKMAGDARSWKRILRGFLMKTAQDRVPRARLVETPRAGTFAVLAVAMAEGISNVQGAMALVVPCSHPEAASARLSELRSAIVLADTLAQTARAQPAEPDGPSRSDLTAAVRAGQYADLDAFCFTLVNDLKNRFGFTKVALGRVHRHRVKILAISGFDDLYPRSPGSRQIAQAMEECCDAGHIVAFQIGKGAFSTGHALHRAWHDASAHSPVASIPLEHDGRCVAVLSVRNPSGRPLSEDILRRVQQMVQPLVPGLLLLERAHRSVLRHAWDAARDGARALLGPGHVARKVMLAAGVALAAWVVFGTQAYRIHVPCTVAPARLHQLTAPFESRLASVSVRPGDRVEKDMVVARFDTAPLELERARLLAERRVAELKLKDAVAANDVAAAGQARAEWAMVESRLAAVEWKLARSAVRAPFDGVVLDGDLVPKIGDVIPLGEPLMQVGSTDEWRVELHVPAFAAADLRPGQRGWFATTARPHEAQPFTVSRISGATRVVDGKNVVVVEARLLETPPNWVRAGMRGVAQIDAGNKPIWWVWTHRTLDRIRLWLWQL